MNKDTYGEALRIKSSRRRRRDIKKYKDKKYIRLDKQRDELRQKEQDLGFEPLEAPYQKGFKRSFVVREELHSEAKNAFYNELLPYINTMQYSLRKDFKKRKRIRRKKVYVETLQEMREYCYGFHKIPDQFKSHFVKKEKLTKDKKQTYFVYVFAEPWRYKLKVEPHIITHRKVIDNVLNSEIQQLENYIERQHLEPKIAKAKSARHQYKWEHYLKHQEVLPPIFKILNNIKNELD